MRNNLKITMLTESLGSGGAERQMCTLAAEMARRGHEIEVVTYAPGDFFLPLLAQSGVRHTFLGGKNRWQWLPRIRRFLRKKDQDVVVAYLGTCASYAELASLPWRRWGLVVSERLAFSGWFKGFGYLRKNLHILADAVIANSHTNRLMIEKSFPWLKGKTITIYNVIDNKIFTYAESHINKNNIQIVMACRIHHQKNILGLIEAFALIKNNPQNYRISVDIYGSPGPDSLYINKCLDAIKTWNLQDYVKLHKPHNNIVAVYRQADAVLLPSFWEGLPNTICEAMSCGKPILMSNACDAGNLVEQGENGFLFDPHDTASMAAAIFKFAALTPAKRHKMGVRSRYKAERLFDLQTIADRFENLLFCATQRKKIPINHWPPEVPQTAFRYTELDALS